jgi:dTDP-4-dehydrorhamnose reductase
MKILVAGGAGQLARGIREEFAGHYLVMPPESVLDLSSQEAIRSVLAAERPQVLINAAAFTQVDLCETKRDLAMLINGQAVAWLAEACEEQGAMLVQISTDYVFDGTSTRPYREGDPVHPQSVYGESKLLGECGAALASRHLIMRTAWLYDAWGKNFYLTMCNAARQGRPLRVVDDQVGSPTTCRALSRQLKIGIEQGWQGLIHGTCSGQTSWHGFAAEIFRQAGISADLNPCATSEYLLPAKRPAFSVLDGSHRSELGTDLMPDWREALAEVIADPKHT